MMKALLAPLAALGLTLSPLAALAQDAVTIEPTLDFDFVDTDGSGDVSWVEFQAAFDDAELTEFDFNVADADGDGYLNLEEFELLALSTGSVND